MGRAHRARSSDVDLIPELPYGPAAMIVPHQRPDTWQHPITRSACPKILLAPEGASTHAHAGRLSDSVRHAALALADAPFWWTPLSHPQTPAARGQDQAGR